MIVTQTQLIPAPLEKVAEVLCSEAFNVEVESGREGVVSTRYEQTREDDQELRFVMHSQEYARKKTGGLDRKKVLPTSMTSVYRRADDTLTWDYRDAAAGTRMVLRGTYRLTAHGNHCRMVHEVEIEVRVPIIGRQIAKFIARQFEKDYGRYRAAMERHVKG